MMNPPATTFILSRLVTVMDWNIMEMDSMTDNSTRKEDEEEMNRWTMKEMNDGPRIAMWAMNRMKIPNIPNR